jgi:hypothetical protein
MVDLRGLNLCLTRQMPIYLHVRSVSFRFSPANYLRVCFRVLTASRAVITRDLSIRGDRSTTEHQVTIPVTDIKLSSLRSGHDQEMLTLAAPNADWFNPKYRAPAFLQVNHRM